LVLFHNKHIQNEEQSYTESLYWLARKAKKRVSTSKNDQEKERWAGGIDEAKAFLQEQSK
jgi:hypothetical protein